ncbi:MAG: SPOR domain-containing protein [Aestuariivirgaceae bacterium]
MAQNRSAGPDGFGDRRALTGPARQALTPYTKRETGATGAARQRPAKPESISDDPKWDSSRGVRMAKLARGVLLGGMLLAVVGVVQAAWMPEEKNLSPSVAQESLGKQIDQLKAELDQERAEKSELLEKLATAESPAEPAAVETPPEPAPLEPAVAEAPALPAAVSPAVAPAQGSIQQASADILAPGDDRSVEKARPGTLPQPMAPSAELLLTAVPVQSGETAGESGAYGIHLASFADRTMAERGWALLQRNHPIALGDLKPRVDEAKDENGKPVFLLIAGPFDKEALAAAHCRKITTQVVFCKPRPFSGSEFVSAVAQ